MTARNERLGNVRLTIQVGGLVVAHAIFKLAVQAEQVSWKIFVVMNLNNVADMDMPPLGVHDFACQQQSHQSQQV